MASEKFCLRWNDFETNISSAFREIRDDKEFFDVTLASEDDSQIQAHKVIIAACSPFFRQVLRRNSHQHPLLYLKGVKFKELESVLSFMYHGEVNIAQDDLNTFLAVAEELRVKGLTQGNSSSGTQKQESSSSSKPVPIRPRGGDEPPAAKKPRPAPVPASYQPHQSAAAYDEDDIQEVAQVPVKAEPGTAAMATAASMAPGYGAADTAVALEEQYDESYDYGQYGEGGYDDGSGMMDPATGLPMQAADGNKGGPYLASVKLRLVTMPCQFNGLLMQWMSSNKLFSTELNCTLCSCTLITCYTCCHCLAQV